MLNIICLKLYYQVNTGAYILNIYAILEVKAKKNSFRRFVIETSDVKASF